MNIQQYPLPENQYHAQEFPKTQIVIHHTASGPSAKGNIDYWKTDPVAVATAFVIGKDGIIQQAFASKYYAAHLGIPAAFIHGLGFNDYSTRCDTLHKQSIGIELTCWGGLTQKNGKWLNYLSQAIPDANVQTYSPPFRGFAGFEKYSAEQLTAVKELILYLCNKYKIPTTYHPGMWDISKDAIGGVPGIWTHTSYRIASDKQDCHPQPELIALLQSLSTVSTPAV
ncbi:N-acetylmuramoyl-L-alanine amidase [Mucilaginibacter corticis]|uniref:N-acetylmuramoyl-L-alanine amidase n=1 Tax=Mucilaginibacter corticis TaxID=2597670 RepID=A0A556MUQ9_9SPHI|nr:peptidoglycan recognition family protein [Mucilaginibacter corticis]TSJ43670.1 N-acetylmuramoyl-L-alanine amidase [Mucilaginibacter corticis]